MLTQRKYCRDTLRFLESSLGSLWVAKPTALSTFAPHRTLALVPAYHGGGAFWHPESRVFGLSGLVLSNPGKVDSMGRTAAA